MWRLDNLIRDGRYANWKEIVDDVNFELYGDDEEKHKGESAYRKPVKNVRDFLEAGVFDSAETKRLNKKLQELEQKKVQLRDERTAFNKQISITARINQKLEYMEQEFLKIGRQQFPKNYALSYPSDNDILAICSDLHVGQSFNNKFGCYNTDIAHERLGEYAEEIIKIGSLHSSENCYVSLQGDLISGSIHKAVAITNRENVIDQIKIATELIASFVYELSGHFKNIYVSSVVGNHSRIDRKEDAIHDERLDDLISWVLKFILKDSENIHILEDNKLDSGMSILTIRGKEYISVHGDYDSFSKSGASNLVTFLGYVPYAIILGHMHTCGLDDANGIKLIRSGSLAGSGDQYTIEKRLSGKPSQMVCVCSPDGIRACYPVELK